MTLPNLKHVEYDCFRRPCRNAQHWKLFAPETNKENKSTFDRIDAMRQLWYGIED